MKQLSWKEQLYIGLMLFALFFGAGNLVFPPGLGFSAGENLWQAMLGFLITAVGLPILGVAAIANSGGLDVLTNRVHPIFAVIFTLTTYLCLGPFLVIPRAGNVAFEMGVVPFLPDFLRANSFTLSVYTFIYFAINFWLCLNPSKMFARIGKILTPILLTMITIIFIQSQFHPIGDFGNPAEAYLQSATFKGFMEGYMTMDTLAALLFGGVIVAAFERKNISNKKQIARLTMRTGVFAGLLLALIYLMLGYLGSVSQSLLPSYENGGEILTAVSTYLFGQYGTILLGTVFTLACVTTSVGLITSCGQYFAKLMPRFSYTVWTGIVCFTSMVIANLGLNQIIVFSVPILLVIYPLTIVLIVLSFGHSLFNGYKSVYKMSLLGTAMISLVDALQQSHIDVSFITDVYRYLPLYEQGIGWVLPALVGACIGFLWGKGKENRLQSGQKENISHSSLSQIEEGQ
ncbi:branched-chain amino acid transport system II carrier protein [Brevibacillus laterosporus]|uniref:branched-chain amino acid transport system II carrier protein n=1 Tax=Brevibacillus laterosporus TaxID=1465 RepID=UPI000E6D2F6E|nr:branched-chain amino acid transport system II carrier protein [Brevibacillus laterosporus]AYB38096.1 branched-chain amino acid transport system II carrier protein [Brevibacillus laterosporus]MBM7111261.1 Branched-chain amino acid transport system 2 carrier protein [Brevibacillus laterosporus]